MRTREEHLIFIHPLAREDQHLIQDFMLTKIALLLARHADDKEWLFEMQAMDDQSKPGQGRGHAFLFIYTVVRYYVAASRLNAEVAVGKSFEPLKKDDSFYNDFATAIASNDGQAALNLWGASPHAVENKIAGPTIRQMASSYLQQVTVPEAGHTAAKIADYLPGPFVSSSPDQPAGRRP